MGARLLAMDKPEPCSLYDLHLYVFTFLYNPHTPFSVGGNCDYF